MDTTTHTASGGDVPNEDVACGGEVVELAEEIGGTETIVAPCTVLVSPVDGAT